MDAGSAKWGDRQRVWMFFRRLVPDLLIGINTSPRSPRSKMSVGIGSQFDATATVKTGNPMTGKTRFPATNVERVSNATFFLCDSLPSLAALR